MKKYRNDIVWGSVVFGLMGLSVLYLEFINHAPIERAGFSSFGYYFRFAIVGLVLFSLIELVFIIYRKVVLK